MTGLDLEHYLRLLRTEPAIWLNAAIGTAFVAAIIWASHGRRRMLQRCLILSLGLHIGIVVYGGRQASRWMQSQTVAGVPDPREHMRSVQLIDGPKQSLADERFGPEGRRRAPSVWDHPEELQVKETPAEDSPPMPRPELQPPSRDVPETELAGHVEVPDPVLHEAKITSRLENNSGADVATSSPSVPIVDNERATLEAPGQSSSRPVEPSGPDVAEVDVQTPSSGRRRASGPDRPGARPDVPEPVVSVPNSLSIEANHDLANRAFAERVSGEKGLQPLEIGEEKALGQPAISTDVPPAKASSGESLVFPEPGDSNGAMRRDGRNAQPGNVVGTSGPGRGYRRESLAPSPGVTLSTTDIPTLARSPGSRPEVDVPDVYRSRVAPNRSALALAAGATRASEEAVEHALDWLAKHQDADGRWNAGVHAIDGRPLPGEKSFAAHCPPADQCVGDCYYWEADTAITGLALLAFLGAGHTHQSGPYAANVERGIEFLLASQKPDGDLRGNALSVGMYCHAIATLALSEDYAMTRDERIRPAVERAVAFLISARTRDKQSWRYEPGDPMGGDTSVLGWAVMVLKSAREVGIAIPADARLGVLAWLERVSVGKSGGLAMYRPAGMRDGGPITPSMTAEAWVCRQFLGVGGPGPASDEAAAYLLEHGPDRDPFNLYYWYYATIALFQHGGDAWIRWNARVRDNLVLRQVRSGHADGSWDPREDRDKYNNKGGRVYATALAALTLEVYYRYLPMYNSPASASRTAKSDMDLMRTRVETKADDRDRVVLPDGLAPEVPDRQPSR